MFNTLQTARLYAVPLTPAYWRDASHSMRCLRLLIFAALTVAMARALSLIPSIPIGPTKFSFGFLARALCSLVCGPVMGMSVGFVEDILGYALQPEGAFFIGYTISTMAGMLVYGLCFYRARITVARLVVANLLVNVFVNALMGSVWNMIIYQSPYWAFFWPSLGKNLVTIVPKVILMYVAYQGIIPVLQQVGHIPRQLDEKNRITWI